MSTHGDLGLLRTTDRLSPSIQVGKKRTPRSTFVSLRLRSLGVSTSPVNRLVSTKSGSDRRGREEGDSEESTDRGHREGFEMGDEECLRVGFLIVALGRGRFYRFR